MFLGSLVTVLQQINASLAQLVSIQKQRLALDMTPQIVQALIALVVALTAQIKAQAGDAAALADYDTVRDRMKSSRYTMDFQNGVKFDMAVVMSDTLTAATAATLMKGVSIMRKTSGSPLEKSALDQTTIDSNAGTLTVSYASSDSQFASLLTSSLFQSVVK